MRKVTAVLLLCAAPIAAFAQVSAASISGTARDTSGAAIPAATVIVRNIETNVETRTTTNG